MPMIQVNMVEESATDEEKAALIRALAQAAHDSLGAPWGTIRVWINQFPRANFIVGTALEDSST